MEVRKIRWLSPERAEPGGEGSVTVAPDSHRSISIATGPSLRVCLSVCLLSVCQSVSALWESRSRPPSKVGHEKMELTDMTRLLWEGAEVFLHRFLKCRRDAWSCQLL